MKQLYPSLIVKTVKGKPLEYFSGSCVNCGMHLFFVQFADKMKPVLCCAHCGQAHVIGKVKKRKNSRKMASLISMFVLVMKDLGGM